MASLYSKDAGKKLLKQVNLLNGSGKENLKLISQRELARLRRNIPINRQPKK